MLINYYTFKKINSLVFDYSGVRAYFDTEYSHGRTSRDHQRIQDKLSLFNLETQAQFSDRLQLMCTENREGVSGILPPCHYFCVRDVYDF